MISVIVVGHSFVGKNMMISGLKKCSQSSQNVKLLSDVSTERAAATKQIEEDILDIQCELYRTSNVSVKRVNTHGELFRNWDATSSDWQNFINHISESKYIILLLHPLHSQLTEKSKKEIIDQDIPEDQKKIIDKDIPYCYKTFDESKKNFEQWTKLWSQLYQENRFKAKNILICRHKFDACHDNIKDIGDRWKYSRDRYDWAAYFRFTKSYFHDIEESIKTFEKMTEHKIRISRFITSIENRSLLELPWIFIASREAKPY